MDKSPREKSQYREMLTKKLSEEDETFKFQSTKDLVSTGSDEEQEEDERERAADIKPKSAGARFDDLLNYKNLFYSLLFIIIGVMAASLYSQNKEMGLLSGNVIDIRGDIGHLETDVNLMKEKYGDSALIQKDLEYIKGRLSFIENKLPF